MRVARRLWWLAPTARSTASGWRCSCWSSSRASGCWPRSAALDDADHHPARRTAGPPRAYRFINHPNYRGRDRRDRGAAAGVRPVAGGADLHRCSTPPCSTVRIRAENRALRPAEPSLAVPALPPISRLSPRHRQMPEAGAPRLRSERRLDFSWSRVTDVAASRSGSSPR